MELDLGALHDRLMAVQKLLSRQAVWWRWAALNSACPLLKT